MGKRMITFRATPECELQMAKLMDRWGCDRTAVLIKAVELAHGLLDKPERTPLRHLTPDEQHLMHRNLSGRPDPDKLAAFQKRAGMGGVKSRG